MTTRNKRSWAELSAQQRAGSIIIGMIQITLLIATLRDLRRRPAEQINGPKWAWTLAAFVNVIGPISYFMFGRKR